MNNITQNQTANFNENKDITLTSYSETNNTNSLIRADSLTSHMINNLAGSLTLENIIVDGNNIEAQRSAIMINNGTKLNINQNTTIKNCHNISTNNLPETHGGAINVLNLSTVVVSSGTFSNNVSSDGGGGGVFYASEAYLQIKDGTFTQNKAPRGGAVRFEGGQLTVDNGTFSNNEATNNGGALYVGSISNGGTITINDGTFKNNKAGLTAGGIYVNNQTDKFILNGGEITNNEANYGSGLYVNVAEGGEPTIIVNGGTIDNNVARDTEINTDIYASNSETNYSTFIQSDINTSIKGRGTYFLTNPNSNKVLDVKGGAAANNTIVQIYTKNNSAAAQQWKIRPAKIIDGVIYYNFESSVVNQKYYLDIESTPENISSGAQAEIYEFRAQDDFYWYLEAAEDNTFYIKTKCKNLCLDVKSAETTNGTPVLAYNCNQSNAQKWQFTTS